MSNEKGAKAPLSGAEKAARKREKKLALGLVRLPDYATPEQRELIIEYLAGRACIVKNSKDALTQQSI